MNRDGRKLQRYFKKQAKAAEIQIREGLSVINGTSAMTGIGMINIILAKKTTGLVGHALFHDQ